MSSETSKSNAQDSKSDERGRSTIEFPYNDLEDAEHIVQAVYSVGGPNCTWDQLAVKLGQAPRGGGFRTRVMAARTFKLLDYDRGNISLTDLGIKIADAKFIRAARVEAFLSVELFKAGYEKFKGNQLPPPFAIERQFEQMGVAPKQKDKARQVFMRSAKQAGFFELAADRLVQPNTNAPPSPDEQPPLERNPGGGGGSNGGSGGGDNSNHHPLIRGLLQKLPKPGEAWSLTARAKWLQAAAINFDLIYGDNDEVDQGSIKVSVTKPDSGGAQ